MIGSRINRTTIIKTMSTLLSATSGSITIDGELINKNETAVRKKINMIVGGERMDLCQYLGHNFFRFLRIFFLKFYRT